MEKKCCNCRYMDKSKMIPPEFGLDKVDLYYCTQSAPNYQQYVKEDDWCDRFCGASWINGEKR